MAKYLIIGGVAGGATAAARLRRIDEEAEIIMFERGPHISYANCGLPYYIGNVINDREKLLVQTPESFNQRFNVDVRVMNEVIAINSKNKTVEVKNLKDGSVYTEQYDKLILSPGAEPVKPPIEGINSNKIFTLRSVQDTDKIKSFIDNNKPRHAVVVGAGFMGLEMAENLHHLGIQVTIVEMAEQVMTPLDYEMAAEVHQHLKTKKVQFFLKEAVSAFDDNNDKLYVHLKSGRQLQTDMVILSIGVRPETRLAKEAGIVLGERGGIMVDAYLQTNLNDVYAIGDAIEFVNPITKKSTLTYLAGPANKQGRMVADNIVFGHHKKYAGSINTAIAKVFDITVASTGASEKVLKQENIPYISSIIHVSSHAGYYPGAMPTTIKILFSPDNGNLLGAQIIGYDSVDKRADLIASVVQRNGTIYDLENLEHAYAPPYNSAKSPCNIAGMVAENILQHKVKIIHWDELFHLHSPDTYVLDVRTVDEFALGSVPHAVNIPLDDIRKRINEIPKNKKIVVLCGVGLRGYVACRILMQKGYPEVYNLTGGYKTYEYATQKQSNEDIFENDIIGKDDHIYQAKVSSTPTISVAVKQLELDACGLQCPGPIMKLKNALVTAQTGDILTVKATDRGFKKDVESWCRMTGNKLIKVEEDKGIITAIVQKNLAEQQSVLTAGGNNKTIIVFSDDLDKALASFVIANGAASTGKKVTMFFTFWGLNVIKKRKKPPVKKDLMGMMFGWMMASSSRKLQLSKMNMANMGREMMRFRMKHKKVDSLELMIEQAINQGIQLIACQMSMDVMGVQKEEIFDAVQIGGVATYLEEAEKSNLNLFI
jgi:NADPH-dependent 2,4-dienoyl-CoA reductase/sulfur reductase-like enzyme/peroxiredoxin family protein/rhodanese-related sulfurtransferase/TusA-related sulfurtransferase